MLTKFETKSPESLNVDKCLLPLRNGQFAIIDPEFYPELSKYRWFLKKSKSVCYVVRRQRTPWGTRLIKLHRQITNCPPNKVVHHRNHNPLDNRLVNLVPCLPCQHNNIAAFDAARPAPYVVTQPPVSCDPVTLIENVPTSGKQK